MAQASAEKLEHTGPAGKEKVTSVPQRKQLTSTPEPPLPEGKGTEPSVQSTKSYGERERGRSGKKHGKERVDSTVKKGRFQRGEGGQTREATVGKVEGSMSG